MKCPIHRVLQRQTDFYEAIKFFQDPSKLKLERRFSENKWKAAPIKDVREKYFYE
jgi:hypothetical protein